MMMAYIMSLIRVFLYPEIESTSNKTENTAIPAEIKVSILSEISITKIE